VEKQVLAAQFRLETSISTGRFSFLWKATDVDNNDVVVLKFGNDAEAYAREVRSLQQVRHAACILMA
jgi:serine/threonine protein kinase